jgi:two-component system OmpR family sensor kinase
MIPAAAATTSTRTRTTSTMMMAMTDRWRFRPSFRLRVLGSFVALLAIALLAGLFLQRAVLLEGLEQDIQSALEQEREEMQKLAGGRNPLTGEPFNDDVRAIFDTFLSRNVPGEGEVYIAFVDGAIYKTTPAPLRLDTVPEVADRWGSLAAGERGEIDTEAGPVHYLAVPLRFEGETRGVFVIANFSAGERAEIDRAFRVEAAVSVLVLIVVTLISWFVAGRLLRPVRDLTETAEAITESDLARRIPVDGDDEISRLASTFNEMLDRLETAFTGQRTFIDDAGHELRTPITIIRGHLDVMSDDPDDRAETMALVSDELDRMARIVDDLLILAKAEQPDFLRAQPVELADLTTELLVKSRALGDRSWQLDACAEGVVHFDPQRLTQAVLNLARNAVEHTAHRAEIGIGSGWAEDGVRIWVRDTGIGVNDTEKDRIFERFARGRFGRRSEGAGLGLAIVTSIAAAHGGHVDLDSTPDEGATFTIVLPGSPPNTATTTRITAAASSSDTLELEPTERVPSWPES